MYKLKICELAEMPSPETFLSAREKTYYDTLKFEKRRNDHALGRYTLKKLLQESFINAPLNEIEILRSENGFPELYFQSEKSALKVSLSHSNAVGLAVASTDVKSIGADIELIESRSKKWAEHCFYFTEFTDGASDEYLTELWCKKEAVLKMLGVGLSVSFYDLRFEKGKINIYGRLLDSFKNIEDTEIEIKRYKNFVIAVAFKQSGL